MLTFALAGALAAMAGLDQSQATLHVSATVVPHCQISVGDAASGARAVTASCAASTLRVLRVTSNGRALQPQTSAGRHLRAGGDAVFLVSRDLIPGPAGGTVLVTLDF